MAQNYDLIEVVAGVTSGECNCSASDFSDSFIAKLNGNFNGFLYNTDGINTTTVWTPNVFVLGYPSSIIKSTITAQGLTDDKAEVIVKSSSNISSINPLRVSSKKIQTTGDEAYISTTGCKLNDTELFGSILPDTNNAHNLGSLSAKFKKGWFVNLSVEGTLDAGNFSISGPLSLDDDLTIQGNIISSSDITSTGDITADNITVVTTLISQSAAFSGLDSGTGNFQSLTVLNAPTTSQGVVRRNEVYIAANPNVSLGLNKVAVTNGYISNVQTAAAADLPSHTARHHTTTKTTNTPASGTGDDPIHSYQIGAVERAEPVVKKPLRITSTDNYTYATAAPYFVVLEPNQEPAASGPEGQIIFRKAQV